jgi:PAS domain S-box-containing protein
MMEAKVQTTVAGEGVAIASGSITELLAEWRAAERRWERPAAAAEVRSAAVDVVRAWAAYQDAALPPDSTEFMLVADDQGAYVAATRGVTVVLGYRPEDLVGRYVADLASPDLRDSTPLSWGEFLAAGRQDGSFRLQASDGRVVPLMYQARAHHPIPGYHVSRLWPDASAAE